jgi:catechol 2,3-dioxygenase-like lactoylglutathione lyase family enzyme
MNLEVVTLPVSDVARAKAFYQGLGWRLDIDLVLSDSVRTVQFTPPHSQCSIQFGQGGSTAAPGSAQMTFLVVDNIDAARDDLINRGVDVSAGEVARTSRVHRSATRMGTRGCSRRSRPAFAPPHNWWDWYAAYAAARTSGSSEADAAAAAGRYMADVKHVVVSAG